VVLDTGDDLRMGGLDEESPYPPGERGDISDDLPRGGTWTEQSGITAMFQRVRQRVVGMTEWRRRRADHLLTDQFGEITEAHDRESRRNPSKSVLDHPG
jgi:hypothetical protein